MNITERIFGRAPASALDALSRDSFASEEDYLLAAARRDLETNSPEFREAYRRVSNEYSTRQAAAQKKQDEADFRGRLSSVKLSEGCEKEIEARAVDAARLDLAANRILASDFTKTVERYRKEFTEPAKRDRAAGDMFNNVLREHIRASRIVATEK